MRWRIMQLKDVASDIRALLSLKYQSRSEIYSINQCVFLFHQYLIIPSNKICYMLRQPSVLDRNVYGIMEF